MNLSYFSPKEAYAIRRRFVNKFVDKTLEFYRYSMGHGDFYGTNSHPHCLWESFRNYHILSQKIAIDLISKIPEVIVTWDISPSKLSSNLQKTRLVKISGADLAYALTNTSEYDFNPSDVYVFDVDTSFHITFTRQNVVGFGKVCITSLELEDYGISPVFVQLFKTLGIAQFNK